MNKILLHSVFAAALALGAAAAGAQSFTLEGAVIDSRSSQSLGVVTERGDISTLFRAQKAMSFGILRSAGISLEQLSPEVRARIERFQTTNLDAFRAFSEGLDLKDQGKFAEAKEQFRRAAELDPGFGLAAEQQLAMPEINVSSNLQMRAVMAAAAGAAVDRGKAGLVVDLARAVAAIAAGQSVGLASAATIQAAQDRDSFSVNPPGSGTDLLPTIVAALAYSTGATPASRDGVFVASEWKAGRYSITDGVLVSLDSDDGFGAKRGGAAASGTSSTALADGSTVSWGSWLSTQGASASVSTSSRRDVSAPELGRVDYVFGDRPNQLPTTNTTLVFSPTPGMLADASGTIAVNFASRNVVLQDLGFRVGEFRFSGLRGTADYSANVASGPFSGLFTAGACTGCTAFVPQASAFAGNFVGRQGHGLVLSTLLATGAERVSGVQLYTRPGPGP